MRKQMIKKPVNVPHIPTTAELVDEQIDEVLESTLELLDERLFYVYDKYSDYNADEFSAFVTRALEGLEKKIVDKVKEWDGNDTSSDEI